MTMVLCVGVEDQGLSLSLFGNEQNLLYAAIFFM